MDVERRGGKLRLDAFSDSVYLRAGPVEDPYFASSPDSQLLLYNLRRHYITVVGEDPGN